MKHSYCTVLFYHPSPHSMQLRCVADSATETPKKWGRVSTVRAVQHLEVDGPLFDRADPIVNEDTRSESCTLSDSCYVSRWESSFISSFLHLMVEERYRLIVKLQGASECWYRSLTFHHVVVQIEFSLSGCLYLNQIDSNLRPRTRPYRSTIIYDDTVSWYTRLDHSSL